MRLTQKSHMYIKSILKAGDIAIDATVGNGYDTIYLAELVGQSGHVIGFDIQEDAISITLKKLQNLFLESRVTLFYANHRDLDKWIPEAFNGKIKVVVFNLGYLPGGNKNIITLPESTIDAFNCSLNVLCLGGSLVVLVYTGHKGGVDEWRFIQKWLLSLDTLKYRAYFLAPCSSKNEIPKLFVVNKI